MDAAPALRALAVVLAAAAGLGAAGCGGAAPPAGRAQEPGDGAHPRSVTGAGLALTSGEPDQVHAKVAAALRGAGHSCRATADRVVCEGAPERSASFYVVYRPYPARLLFGSPWRLKTPCVDAIAALNAFNWTYDELSASCDPRGTVIVQGAYFIPRGGLTADDVVAYANWWTLAEVRALASSEVGAMLE